MRNTFKRLEASSKYNNVDPIEAVLFLSSGKYTILPELFEIFGRAHTLRFLEFFGGKQVKIPHVHEIERSLESLEIWASLRADSSKRNLKKLGTRYGLKEGDLKSAAKRVQEMFDDQATQFFSSSDGDEVDEEEDSTEDRNRAEVEEDFYPEDTLDFIEEFFADESDPED